MKNNQYELWGNSQSKIADARRKFGLSLNKAFNKYLIPVLEEQKEELSIAYMNRILNREGPTKTKNTSTPETKLLAEVSIGAFEIFTAYESLLDSEVYVRRFPYRGTRISKSRHLKSVLENHLNNIYILKERMVKYLKILTKKYGRRVTSKGKPAVRITEVMRRFTEEYLDPLKAVRNSHMHNEEFYDSDLERLSILENYIQSNPTVPRIEYFKTYYDHQFEIIRKNKVKQIQAINADINKLLDIYFNHIHTIVFDEDDELIIHTLE
ncbi:TPA: hypothetical protein ENS27_02980 [bacterium]|nr:hypothetical protein [bacterium]